MAGIEGVDVQSPKEALSKINQIISKNEAGLVLLSDDIGKDIRIELAKIRSIKPIPLIFELPSPGSKKEKVDYRALLKQILGVWQKKDTIIQFKVKKLKNKVKWKKIFI